MSDGMRSAWGAFLMVCGIIALYRLIVLGQWP
mgnify:CR=1 FL=1